MFRAAVIFIAFFLISLPAALLAEIEDLRPLEESLQLTEEGRHLSLKEAVRLAILRSLDIKIRDLDRKSKNAEILKSKSIYDTTFDTSFEYEHDSKQNASRIAGTKANTGNFDLSFEKKLLTGTDITVSLEHERSSTNSSFATLNPSYRAVGKLSVTQPILKNAFGFLDRSEVKLIKIDVEHFDYETRNRIEEAMRTVIDAYWQLVWVYEVLEARVEALERAKEFWEVTAEKFTFGMAEKPDLYAAEANVRNRFSDALVARHEVENQVNQVQVLLDLAEDEWMIPTERPQFKEFSRSLDDALVQAFTNRRDYEQAKLDIEMSNIRLRMKKNSLWPELDLEGSYASNALDLNVQNAEGEVFGFNHPTYFAKAALTWPLENREARAEFRQAKYEKEKKILAFKKLEQEIYREIDDHWRGVLMSYKRAEQSEKVRDLQAKKLEEEEKNFRQGRSSTKAVIDFQDDSIEAKLRASEDLVAYERAKIDLLRTENTLLETLGISA